MDGPEWFRREKLNTFLSARWVVLGAGVVITVSILAVGLGPGDELSVDRPSTEFDWTKSDGDLVVTQRGGEPLERETLYITGDGLDYPITDLGDGDDDRIVRPFGGTVVSDGDTLVIDGDALGDGEIALRWDKPGSDQGATLLSLEDFHDSNRTPRSDGESR